jgi:hypothetical protein
VTSPRFAQGGLLVASRSHGVAGSSVKIGGNPWFLLRRIATAIFGCLLSIAFKLDPGMGCCALPEAHAADC